MPKTEHVKITLELEAAGWKELANRLSDLLAQERRAKLWAEEVAKTAEPLATSLHSLRCVVSDYINHGAESAEKNWDLDGVMEDARTALKRHQMVVSLQELERNPTDARRSVQGNKADEEDQDRGIVIPT